MYFLLDLKLEHEFCDRLCELLKLDNGFENHSDLSRPWDTARTSSVRTLQNASCDTSTIMPLLPKAFGTSATLMTLGSRKDEKDIRRRLVLLDRTSKENSPVPTSKQDRYSSRERHRV